MPSFNYIALDGSGKQVNGSLSVSTRAEAYRKLELQRLTPVKISEETRKTEITKERVNEDDSAPALKRTLLIHFTEELSDLLDGGLQLEQALRVMEERQESVVVRNVSRRIREQLREGSTFSKALANASPSFDDLYCNLASAGEVSGMLPQILRRICASVTQIQELQSRVVQAMIYPAFMIGALIVLMIVFSTVLIPQLTGLLAKTGQKLPFATQILIKVSDFVGSWWWLMLVIATAVFLSFRAYIGTDKGRLWWHQAKLGIPLFGPVIESRFYAQLCGTLGNLVNNGVPLLNALKLGSRATPNLFFRNMLARVAVMVGEGASLSGAMRKTGVPPALLTDMVAVGEQTGNLGRSLEKAAARYDKELDQKIKRMTAMITPVVIIIMAVVVCVVALSIVNSIFSSMSTLHRR